MIGSALVVAALLAAPAGAAPGARSVPPRPPRPAPQLTVERRVRLDVRVFEGTSWDPIEGATIKLAGTAYGSVTGPNGLATLWVVPDSVALGAYYYAGAHLDTTVFVTPEGGSITLRAPARPPRWVEDPDPTGFGETDLYVVARTDSGHRAVRGIIVRVRDAFGRVRTAVTDRHGRARFRAVRGAFAPVWTTDTLGLRGLRHEVDLLEVRATRDTFELVSVEHR